MGDLYSSYSELAAAETEGTDYLRTSRTVPGATWAAIAVHGGGIEPGSGEVADAVAADRMVFYEFDGIKPTGNTDLHITSTLFDEPICVDLVARSRRTLSFHGYAGTAGVAETAIGGLDADLRDRVADALTAAGFTVVAAPVEISGAEPANICNENASGAGVQLELSEAQRAAFFPNGDLSRTSRDSEQRTQAFHDYVAAVQSVALIELSYDDQLSRVRLSTVAPGVHDTFTRDVVDGWGASDSGHTWTLDQGAASEFAVSGGVASMSMASINVSRWQSLAMSAADVDVTATVATDALAVGGPHFPALAARYTDPDNCYLTRLGMNTDQSVFLTLRKRVAGTETFLKQDTPGLTHAAGTQFSVRLQVIGSSLRARVWLAGTVEPDVWNLEHTDTDITGAGRIACRGILSSSNTNTLPVTITWDDVRTLGTASVQRSTNGITWAPVRGGSGLDGDAGATVSVDDYEFTPGVVNHYRVQVADPVSGAVLFTEGESITPVLDTIWLKSMARPFLNRPVTLTAYSDIARGSRNGVFDIVGRTLPVAVTDVRGSRAMTITVMVPSVSEADDLDQVLASGDPILLHVPPDCPIPGMYAVVGTVSISRRSMRGTRRYLELPLTEVAAPGPDVVGDTVTWQSIVNAFATWDDLVAAEATWHDVAERIGDPGEVVVP